MNFSFRTARNLGLFILLVIIIIESLFAYISMSKSAERLTAIITVDQVKLRHWYDVAEIITHAKDKLYDYRLGQTDVVASVDWQPTRMNLPISMKSPRRPENSNRPSMPLQQKCEKDIGADLLPGKWKIWLSGRQIE
jgi:putative lipase involved disintegration of autophagic bodies